MMVENHHLLECFNILFISLSHLLYISILLCLIMYIYVNIIVKIYTLQTSYILEMYTENLWNVLPRFSLGNERFFFSQLLGMLPEYGLLGGLPCLGSQRLPKVGCIQ